MSDINQNYKLEGLEELLKALQELPEVIQVKIFKSFVRKVGKKFIVDNLKTLLPYSDKTKSRIAITQDKSDPTAIFAGITSKAFWIRFQERGTVDRKTKKGYNRGQIVGNRKVESIVDSQIDPIIDYTNDQMGAEVSKWLDRNIKNTNKKLNKLNN